MKNVAVLFFLISFVLTSGCATIVSKSEWPVQIASTPDGADVSITDVRDGKKVFTAKTPTSVVLTAKGGF
jgi:uncharacterized protein YceK